MEDNQSLKNIESFQAHKLVSLATKYAKWSEEIKAVADQVDPDLWSRMEEKSVQDQEYFERKMNALSEANTQLTRKFYIAGACFLSASLGVSLGHVTPDAQISNLNTALLMGGFFSGVFMAAIAYKHNKDYQEQSKNRPPPNSFHIPNLVREELLRLEKEAETPLPPSPDNEPA